MTKQEADFIGSMNMCDEISNEAYKKIMCNCEVEVEEQQPCDDVLSRQTVLQCIKQSREGIDWGQSEDADAFLHYSAALYRTIASKECFPSVTPQPCEKIKEIPKDYKYDTETEDFLVYRHKYTGHEIHIEKPVPRYRLEQPSFEEWLSSFNTDSAPQCFNAVQELKKQIEKKQNT